MPDEQPPTNTIDSTTISPEDAAKTVWLTKQVSDKLYSEFLTKVNNPKNPIPWLYTDKRFLHEIQELKIRLLSELQLQNETALKQATEESFTRALSKEEREGMMRGIKQIQAQEKAHREDLFRHSETLVDKYIDTLKKRTNLSPDQESKIRAASLQATEQTMGKGPWSETAKQIALATVELGVPPEDVSATTVTLELPPELETSARSLQRLSETTKTVLTSNESVSKSEMIDLCLANPELDVETITTKYAARTVAAQIFALSEPVKEQIQRELDGLSPAQRKVAFEKAADTAKQGLSRPVSDFFNTVGVSGPRSKELFSGMIDIAIGKSLDQINEPGGALVVDGKPVQIQTTDPEVAKKIKEMKQGLDARRAEKTETYQKTRSFFRRGAAKAGEVDQKIIEKGADFFGPQIQQGIYYYLSTASIKATPFAHEYLTYFLLSGSDIWRNVLGISTKKVAGNAVKAVAAGTAKEIGAKATGAIAGGAAVGGPVGAVLGFISVFGSKIGSFVSAGVRGIVSFLGGGDIALALTGRAGPPPPQKKTLWNVFSWDPGLVVGVLIVIVVLVLAAPLAGAMSFTSLREVVSSSAFMASLPELGGAEKIPGNEDNGWPTSPSSSGVTATFVVPPPAKVCDASGKNCVTFQPGASGQGDGNCGSGSESSDFTPAEWAMVQTALATLSQSPTFMSYVNSGVPITISRNRTDYGGGCFLSGNSPRIVLYDDAFSSPSAMLYTMAHELGHAIAHSNPDVYNSFVSSAIIPTEGFLPSYPNEKTNSEDFAETLAMYAHYSDSAKYGNYPTAFPNHYAFAKSIFGGTPISSSP